MMTDLKNSNFYRNILFLWNKCFHQPRKIENPQLICGELFNIDLRDALQRWQ